MGHRLLWYHCWHRGYVDHGESYYVLSVISDLRDCGAAENHGVLDGVVHGSWCIDAGTSQLGNTPSVLLHTILTIFL